MTTRLDRKDWIAIAVVIVLMIFVCWVRLHNLSVEANYRKIVDEMDHRTHDRFTGEDGRNLRSEMYRELNEIRVKAGMPPTSQPNQ